MGFSILQNQRLSMETQPKKIAKKELGKGIRALLNAVQSPETPESKAEAQRTLSSQIIEVALADITANPFQPRQDWDTTSLNELVTSIQALGIIQPVTLRVLPSGKYQLISGERRFRAASLAGLKHVPAYIRTAGDQEMLEMALVENIQRTDLNAVEIAISYQRLMDECDLTHEKLSTRVGKDRSTITNYTRLLKLAPDIQDALRKGQLSMGHARCLAGVHDLLMQRQAFHETIDRQWSVRQLEQYLRGQMTPSKSGSKTPAKEAHLAPALRDIQQQLSVKYGAKVALDHHNTGSGKIVIPYHDEDDLHRLLELLDV